MSDVKDWDPAASNNNSASPDGAPEGMAPSGVNNTIRENMAAVSRGNGLGIKGHLYGCDLSNGTDSDHDIDIAAGEAVLLNKDASGDHQKFIVSALTKQVDANWAAGNDAGGFPSGLTLSADTTYHVFLIGKDDSTVDAGFDTSLTAANLLSDASTYDWYRRIGSLYTDGSSNWVSFSQDGDEFLIDVVNDYSANNPGTSAVSRTLSVPTGIQVRAIHNARLIDSSASGTTRALITSLDQSDAIPNDTIFTLYVTGSGGTAFDAASVIIRTNTSGQIRTRLGASDAGITIYGNTHGWIDTRGRIA